MSTPTVDYRVFDHDRTFATRYSALTLTMRALDGHGEAKPADAEVRLTYAPEFPDGPEPVTIVATEVPGEGGVPEYQVRLGSAQSATPGPYLATWGYSLEGVERSDAQGIMVGESAPAYNALSDDLKEIVEQVWLRLSDLFDSPMGGPHLQVYVQTHFGRNRIAQLLSIALGRINTVRQPKQTFSTDKPFPVEQWGALLSTGLYIETLKHLRRSYLEQPNPVGVNVARLDRSTYSNDWAAILRDEEADYNSMLDLFKIASMGMGSGRVLVAGGAYPRVHGTTHASVAGRAAARGYFLSRGF